MTSEEIWARLASAAADRSGRASQQRADLVAQALTLGSTITADSVGCSITEQTPHGFRTPAASNALSMEIDQAQYDASDGPCVAACRDGRIHSIAVMADEAAYQGFTAAALRRGVKSSLSVPLLGTATPSALNLYARSTSAFLPPHPRAVAMFLARCIAALVTDSTDARLAGDDSPSGNDRRHTVSLAVDERGAESGIGTQAAFAELSARSRAEKRSIYDIADEILAAARGRRGDNTS